MLEISLSYADDGLKENPQTWMSQCPVLSLVQVLPQPRKKSKKEVGRVIDIEAKELQGLLQVIGEETGYMSPRLTLYSDAVGVAIRGCGEGAVMTCRKNHRVTNSARVQGSGR